MSQPTVSPDVAILRRLIDLEQQVAALQRSGQLANAGVRTVAGPASQAQNKGIIIADASGNERVRLGITDSDLATPTGAASLYGLSAKDTNGKVRAMFGQMVNAAGATDYGAAAYDSNGNVIWDSTGLVAVVSRIGNLPPTNNTNITQTSDAAFAGLTVSITTTRTVSLLILGNATFQLTAGTNPFIQAAVGIVGTGGGQLQTMGNGSPLNTEWAYGATAIIPRLAPGTYTVSWHGNVSASSTGQCKNATLDVLQFGA